MAKTKRAAVPDSVRHQLASLNNRVSWLEAALKPKKGKAPVDRVSAGYERENAERETRQEAMRDYHEQERIDLFRENPGMFKIAREMDKKESDFLKARGLKPNPSSIPEALRKRARR